MVGAASLINSYVRCTPSTHAASLIRIVQEVKHSGSPTTEESYTITASLDKTVQISVTFTKPANAPGFKFGAGENGGMSTFGKEQADGKRDGYVVQYVGASDQSGLQPVLMRVRIADSIRWRRVRDP